MNHHRGYTLIELIVAVGLFALIMLLASGAYLMMISLSRQAQGMATGIDNLSFALETMTRTIRTGTSYSCGVALDQGPCPGGGGTFFFKNTDGVTISYSCTSASGDCSLSSPGIIRETVGGDTRDLTDPSVTVSSLSFYVVGTAKDDKQQPHVTITVSGSVSAGPGRPSQSFSIETGATMRGIDL